MQEVGSFERHVRELVLDADEKALTRGLDEISLEHSAALGGVWEAFVYAELRKALVARAPDHQLTFYRDNQGREVDFMISGGDRVTCVECKWTELPRLDDARWLRDVEALLQASSAKPARIDRVIAARPAASYPLKDGTRVMHGAVLADDLFPVSLRQPT